MLHATTTIFTPFSPTSSSVICRAKLANVMQGTGSVRITAGVAEVHEVFVGKQVDDGAGHREPAEAAVEHADGPIVHLVTCVVSKSER